MRNRSLAFDHVHRAEVRLRVLDVLFDAESWADVVREAQEVVELSLKGLLRSVGVVPPCVPDVSDILKAERDRLPKPVQARLAELVRVSRELRRDRELAFYGAEDLTPSGFYQRQDAERASDAARSTVESIAPHVQD